MNEFERDFLTDLGLDPHDPEVVAAEEDTNTHMDLIETLVTIRNHRKLTQADVAVRMGTTQSRVSNFERLGGDPRLTTIFRYARAVGAKVRMNATVFVNEANPNAVPQAATTGPSPAWAPVGEVATHLTKAGTA
jgi:DNA-binding XRE family transcriptional regulator